MRGLVCPRLAGDKSALSQQSIVMQTDEKLRLRYGYPPPPAHSPQLTVHSNVFSLTVRMHEE